MKARWDGKELQLTRLGEKNINCKHADKFPHCSLESIKGVQHKANVKYWKVFQDLANEDELAVSPSV